MANWKKVIVSGSSADLAALNVDGTIDASIITVSEGSGSFSGSFAGDGSGLTNVPATGIVLSNLTDGDGIVDFTYNGQSPATVTVEASGSTISVTSTGIAVAAGGITPTELASNSVITAKILNGNVTNAKLENSSIYMAGGAGLTGDGSTALGASGSLAVGAGDGITVTADAVSVNTGSAHFISGSRKSISVSDTTGASGIDLTYDNGTGVLSGTLVNSDVTIGNTTIDLGGTATTLDAVTLTAVKATGSFTGSFAGDGSGLTGVPATGIVLATLEDGNGIANFSYNGQAGASVTVEVSGSTLGVGSTGVYVATSGITTNELANNSVTSAKLATDITIAGDLTVSQDLTVLGTASFQNTVNLDVADRFILLASGSNTTGDGGIVIQQGTQGIGEAFAWDDTVDRWGVTGSFNGSTSAITPDAFMAAVVVGSGTNPDDAPARYDKAGNIFVGTDGEIYIYS